MPETLIYHLPARKADLVFCLSKVEKKSFTGIMKTD